MKHISASSRRDANAQNLKQIKGKICVSCTRIKITPKFASIDKFLTITIVENLRVFLEQKPEEHKNKRYRNSRYGLKSRLAARSAGKINYSKRLITINT